MVPLARPRRKRASRVQGPQDGTARLAERCYHDHRDQQQYGKREIHAFPRPRPRARVERGDGPDGCGRGARRGRCGLPAEGRVDWDFGVSATATAIDS